MITIAWIMYVLFQPTTATGFVKNLCEFVHNGNDVDLSHRHLKDFPSNLSASTVRIDLSYNKITNLNNSQDLPNLRCLDMSHNKLLSLMSNAFELMPKLEELFLNDNELSSRSYPNDVFTGLRLRKLHLHNNNKSYELYPEMALGQLIQLEELSIDTFAHTTFGAGFRNMTGLKRFLLGFKRCLLTYIGNDTFEVFANTKIETINLDYCPLREVDANAFWHFKTLKYLFMSHSGYLSPRIATKSMHGLRDQNMSAIYMDELVKFNILKESNLQKNILSSDVLIFFKDVCVKNLTLKRNRILWLGDIDWSDTRIAMCIEHLDVSGNDLYGDTKQMFKFSVMHNLRHLDVSRHFLRGVKYLSNDYHSKSLDRNVSIDFTLPVNLQYLNLNGFSIDGLFIPDKLIFYNASSLQQLHFAYNGVWKFSNKFEGLENLITLDLSGNICGNMTPNFFDNFTGLTNLNMSSTALDYPENYLVVSGSRLLKPLKKLEMLSLSKNGLSFTNQNIFKANVLKVINLSMNRFERIPFDLKTTEFLQYLDLRYNSLTVLEKSERDLLDELGSKNNLTLYLKGNLLSCACENLDMVFWLYNTQANIEDLERYICIDEDGSTSNISIAYKNLDGFWRRCFGKFWLSVSITCLLVIILAMAFIYQLCRRKTMILNILLRLFGLNTLIKQPSRKDFNFDAFLGYSDHDYQYICTTVSELLENKHRVRVFITDRDMLPGRSISQEIVKAVDASWRVVLVMTQNFLEDNWCRFITDYAVYVSTFRPIGCVLLVLFDDVRRGDIPPAVLNVVEEKDIFNVKEYRHDADALWSDVRSAIICK